MQTMRIFKTRRLILIFSAALGASVGFASPVFAQVFGSVIVNPDGSVTYLGNMGMDSSTAYGINDSGQVVGVSVNYGAGGVPFITGPNGMGVTYFGRPDDSGLYSYARGINDSGQVVGFSEGTGAFITGPNGMGITDLSTPGGPYSQAFGINDSGQVVGKSHDHAFITGPNGMGMSDLGTLGGDFSLAWGVNNAGQVVGQSKTLDGSTHAFITGPNSKGMIDLSSYADLPDGYSLEDAFDINNKRQVIATLVALPIPEPASYALMLAGLGLVGFMARRTQ